MKDATGRFVVGFEWESKLLVGHRRDNHGYITVDVDGEEGKPGITIGPIPCNELDPDGNVAKIRDGVVALLRKAGHDVVRVGDPVTVD